MKIAVLVYQLNGVGGVAKHALQFCREAAALGHDVAIWAVECDRARCYPDILASLEVHALRQARESRLQAADEAFGARMMNYLGSLWQLYREQMTMYSQMPRGYEVIAPFGTNIHWAAYEYKRRYGAPIVWMCDDFFPVGSYWDSEATGVRTRVLKAVKQTLCAPFAAYDRRTVHAMDRIVVLSNTVRSQTREHFGVESTVIRAGVDCERFVAGNGSAIRARYGIAQSTFLLLTVCLLLPRRRLEDAVHAVRSLTDGGLDVAYLIAGGTSYSRDYVERIRAEIANCDLADKVRICGEVAEEELPDYFQACDGFVWAADENQSWGLATMEAMSAGKPAIVSKANGLAEALQDRRNALLVPPRSPDDIAASVRILISDPDLRRAIAQNGRQLVCEKFSTTHYADLIVGTFNEVIDHGLAVSKSGTAAAHGDVSRG